MKHLFTSFLAIYSIVLYSQQDSVVADSSAPYRPTPMRCYNNEGRWFVAADGALGWAYRGIESKQYSELQKCREQHELPAKVPLFGVSAGYYFRNWFNVAIGLGYTESGFNFSERRDLIDTIPMEFVIGCDVYGAVNPQYGYLGPAAFYDPRLTSGILGYHPKSATLNINVRYYQLVFPILAQFNWTIRLNPWNYVHAFANVGISPNYIVKQRYDNSFEGENWNYVLEDSVGQVAPYIRRWNAGAIGNVGILYEITQEWLIGVEGGFQYQIFELFNWRLYGKKDYAEHQYISRLGIQLRYIF